MPKIWTQIIEITPESYSLTSKNLEKVVSFMILTILVLAYKCAQCVYAPRAFRTSQQMAAFVSSLFDSKTIQKYIWDKITIKQKFMP